MKKIIAFECEYCNKILKSRSGMKRHEIMCFKNPASRSCITCAYLSIRGNINGTPFTDEEQQIYEFKVPGTFHRCVGIMECDYNELNSEYEYLEGAELDNYCLSQKCILKKLRHGCVYYKNVRP